MLKQLYLDFSIAGWIFFLLFWLLIAIAVYYYSRTLPPLSRFRRIFLTLLRSLVLIILFFILFQPVIQLIFEKQQKPAVAFLFDGSRSMQIEDSFGMRGDSLQIALEMVERSSLDDSIHVRIYQFSQNLKLLQQDTLNFDGGQTNISLALKSTLDSLLNYNIQNVVLLSDGQFNAGENPMNTVQNAPVPVYTVTVGDTLPRKDLQLVSVRTNPVVYAGDTVSVTASLMHSGYDGEEVIITLKEGSRQLDARKVRLSRSGFEKDVKFSIVTQEPGEMHYSVESEVLPDETSAQNNQKHFLLNVLRSKVKVLIISGQPSLDQRMLLFTLSQMANISYSVFTQASGGQFYESGFEQVPLDSQDLFIFLNYPNRRTRQDYLNRLISSIETGRKPLFLTIGSETDLTRLNPLQEVLPFSRDSRIIQGGQVIAEITGQGLLHSATRVDEDLQITMNMWKNLPPVSWYGRDLVLDKSAAVLIASEAGADRSPEPLLAVSFRREIKSLVLAAAGYGSWHFQLQDDPVRDRFFYKLMENSIRWLINREDIRKIQISTDRKVYKMGESVEFSGQVFNDFYRPIDDAAVNVTINGDNFELKDVLSSQGEYYFYRTAGFPAGTYNYEISASDGDLFLGKTNGRFVVEPLELEMQNTAANPGLMRQIAAQTGGQNWTVSQLLNNLPVFITEEQVQLETLEYVIWNKIYWLMMLILLLSLEWFFRKRWGLL